MYPPEILNTCQVNPQTGLAFVRFTPRDSAWGTHDWNSHLIVQLGQTLKLSPQEQLAFALGFANLKPPAISLLE